jgi:dolichyl-phosphate-mannose--protein O-mannosyl transferase
LSTTAASAPLGWTRADTVAIALVTAAAALLRSIHLTRPSVIVFDEFFYVREACFFVYGSQQTCGIGEGAVSPHPPLGKWLISLGIRAFGFNPLGWRMAALVGGVLTVFLLYFLGRRLLGSTIGAAMAAGLLAIDPLHFVQSRVAMLDVFVTLFIVASFLFLVIDRDECEAGTYESPTRRRGRLARPWLAAAGVAAGAAAATKWVGFLALVGVAALSVTWAVSRQAGGPLRKRIGVVALHEGRQLMVAMVIAPLIVYIVSFAGWIDGSVLSLPWSRGSWVRDFLGVQKAMLRFHLGIQDVSPYTSPAWSWPLIRRSVVYFQEATGGRYQEIIAMGSPIVWWASLPAIAYLGIRVARRRRPSDAAVVVVGGFAVLYLPWLAVASERSFTFLFYLLPAVPFMCLATATVATPWLRSLRGRAVVVVFCALAVASFAFFYPVLTAAPLSQPAVEARQWFTDCDPPPGSLASRGWCWR